jgi:PAS domain S-box/diguanylate cyclase (GGDEF) domain
MKRTFLLIVSFFIFLVCLTVSLHAESELPDFSRIFDTHGSIMLMIDPVSGDILYANNAAVSFYGYSKEQLLSMKMREINTLSSVKTEVEMQKAIKEEQNHFFFKHKLANGEMRDVEVFSYPNKYGNKEVLVSVIQDITAKTKLQQKIKLMTIILSSSAGFIILFFIFLFRNYKRLKDQKKKIENFYELRKTFFDADENQVYLKDENLNYIFVNKMFEQFYQIKEENVIGLHDFQIGEDAFAAKRRKTDLAVLEKQKMIVDEVEWKGKFYKTTKFPVKLQNGKFGVGAYVNDVTKDHLRVKQQQQILRRNFIVVDVLSRSFNSRNEQLDYVLQEALKLTESHFGFIYLYDEETQEFTISTWFLNNAKETGLKENPSRYSLAKAGVWAEAIRQRKAIIINDYEKDHFTKKGLPEGHFQIKRFLAVPIIIDKKIIAVAGFANKELEYDDRDIYEITVLMSGIWNAIERRDVLDKLVYERNKYFQTLLSIGDGVMIVDRMGTIEMLNHVAEKLTGWNIKEAKGKHYSEVFVLTNESSASPIVDPIEGVFRTDKVQELENHVILTARDGSKYDLEDSASPIKDDADNTLGVVLVFRNVTEKKEQRRKIEYLSYHDSLTGLYNRHYFETEMKRLDTLDTLPISIIMGDVNGLKLTNDIFGHTCGDLLLVKVGDVLRRVCRNEDVVARWGGDEFVLLLPSTEYSVAEQLITQIKTEFAKEKVKSLKGSISMGCAVKCMEQEDLTQTLENAEVEMYSAKTLEQDAFRSNAILEIIRALHEISATEKSHSERVSKLCEELGKELKMPEGDIRKLKDVGYLHDIGKIVLDPKLFQDTYPLLEENAKEIKKHPVISYRILNSFDDTLDLAEAALAHHECFDGSGYPKGLKGEEIPVLSRIVALVEQYDRLIHGTKTMPAMGKEDVIRSLKENEGKQFDPYITEVFIRKLKNEPNIS